MTNDSQSSGTGRFFAVDRRCVEDATRYGDGVNSALAYLVLARFTSRNQRSTLAGATSICNSLGLTRGRADAALKTIERAGLVSAPRKGTARTLTPWWLVSADRAKLTARQEAVLKRVSSTANTVTSGTDPDYQVAYALAQKGFLDQLDAKPGKSKFNVTAPDWVWLPNTIVDGFSDADSPLYRLRQIQDARAISLLMDCYRTANLAEDGGLSWLLVRQTFKRVKVGTQGHFTVWGFGSSNSTAQWDPLFTRFRTGKTDKEGHDTGSPDLWRVWGALQSAGLVEYVGHIVESLKPGAQVIHPYGRPGEGTGAEQAVALAAHAAGVGMVTSGQLGWATNELGQNPWLCPVRSHVSEVELVGIARPVHRPQTKRTAAWARNFLHQCGRHQALYESLGKSPAAAAA